MFPCSLIKQLSSFLIKVSRKNNTISHHYNNNEERMHLCYSIYDLPHFEKQNWQFSVWPVYKCIEVPVYITVLLQGMLNVVLHAVIIYYALCLWAINPATLYWLYIQVYSANNRLYRHLYIRIHV